MSDDFNIRSTAGLNNDALRDSLKGGWNKELPAIKDEHGVVIVGHRRLKVAAEEGIEPVIKVVTFGDGPEAEAERIRLANVSNIGGAPLLPADRKRQSERLYKNGLTQEAIAHMLGVSVMTISRDLETFNTTLKVPDRVDRHGRKNTGRPKKKPSERKQTERSKPAKRDRPEPPKKDLDDRGRLGAVDIRVTPDVLHEFKKQAQAEGKTWSAKVNELIAAEVDPPTPGLFDWDHDAVADIAKKLVDGNRRKAQRLYEALGEALSIIPIGDGEQETMIALNLVIKKFVPLLDQVKKLSKLHPANLEPALLLPVASEGRLILDSWANGDDTVRRVRGRVVSSSTPAKTKGDA